jgi:putative FmdB family regulatory protein
MPVYEYECDVCGIRFDLRRRFGESQPTTCPAGHNSIHRVFAPPTIIFKGSGFYVTDNRSSGKMNRPSTKEKETSPAKEPESKTETTKAGDES